MVSEARLAGTRDNRHFRALIPDDNVRGVAENGKTNISMASVPLKLGRWVSHGIYAHHARRISSCDPFARISQVNKPSPSGIQPKVA